MCVRRASQIWVQQAARAGAGAGRARAGGARRALGEEVALRDEERHQRPAADLVVGVAAEVVGAGRAVGVVEVGLHLAQDAGGLAGGGVGAGVRPLGVGPLVEHGDEVEGAILGPAAPRRQVVADFQGRIVLRAILTARAGAPRLAVPVDDHPAEAAADHVVHLRGDGLRVVHVVPHLDVAAAVGVLAAVDVAVAVGVRPHGIGRRGGVADREERLVMDEELGGVARVERGAQRHVADVARRWHVGAAQGAPEADESPLAIGARSADSIAGGGVVVGLGGVGRRLGHRGNGDERHAAGQQDGER